MIFKINPARPRQWPIHDSINSKACDEPSEAETKRERNLSFRSASPRRAGSGEEPIDQAYISTLAALAGTVIGGLTSFLTSYVMQTVQTHNQRRAAEAARRQEVYGSFMDELALLYSRALGGDPLNYEHLVRIFALRGRITQMGTPPVIACADRSVKALVDLYLGPKRGPEEVRAMMDDRDHDLIGEFATLARVEFDKLGLM